MYQSIHVLVFIHTCYIYSTVGAIWSLKYPPPLGRASQLDPLPAHIDLQLPFPIARFRFNSISSLVPTGPCGKNLYLPHKTDSNAPVTWESGQSAHFQLTDLLDTGEVPSSTQHTGSCQVGLSINKGLSWKLVASYQHNCPRLQEPGDQIFNFTVPLGMPAGPAIFAWVWLNREHETSISCALVMIQDTKATARHVHHARSTAQVRGFGRISERSSPASQKMRAVDTATAKSRKRNRQHHKAHRHVRYYISSKRKDILQHGRKIFLKNTSQNACHWDSAPAMKMSYATSNVTA